MKCSSCGRRAIYFRSNEVRYYCKIHFSENIERKVKKTIAQNKLIVEGDTVAVALSGGKDSSNVLYILKKNFGKNPNIKIFALTIDEGIKGYRDRSAKKAKIICKQLRIKHYLINFKKEFGKNMDQIAKKNEHLCSYCGVLRRYILNKKARELGATKLATGHNLDDEAQTILMNLIKGDFLRFPRIGPMPKLAMHKNFVVRIKPLIVIPENESLIYNKINKIPSYPKRCPYARSDRLRGYARRFLNDLDKVSPGVKYSLVQSGYKLAKKISEGLENESIGTCNKCGEPSSQQICKVCELLS